MQLAGMILWTGIPVLDFLIAKTVFITLDNNEDNYVKIKGFCFIIALGDDKLLFCCCFLWLHF